MTKRLAVAPGLETIDERLERSGVSRRAFIKFCSSRMIAAPFGLALTGKLTPEAVAADLGKVIRPHVIWSAHWRGLGCLPELLGPAR